MSNTDNKKTESNNLSIEKEFELRERRLKLVYKILYIAGIAWASLFFSYANNVGIVTPVFCGLLAVFTTAILNILSFVFGELKCMRIYSEAKKQEKEYADNKFSEIWNMFSLSMCFSVLLVILNILFAKYAKWFIVICFILGAILMLVDIYGIKDKKLYSIIKNIAAPMISYAFFATIQIPEVL